MTIAGVVIGAILCVEVVALIPMLVGNAGKSGGVQLMVVDKPRPQSAAAHVEEMKTFAETPAQPATPEPRIDQPRNPEPRSPEGPTFNGRPIRRVRTLSMVVTAYSPDERSCGKFADGITASGYSVWTNGMKLVAADTRILPFKSIVTVQGYNGGRPVPVLDRGGKIKGHRLDLLMPTHEIAREWGKRRINVDVWEYAD